MKAFIYRINAYGFRYIGGTCNFKRRVYDHNGALRSEKKKDHNNPLYVFLRNNGCNKICKSQFEILLETDVKDRKELLKLEQQFMDKECPETLLNQRNSFGKNEAKAIKTSEAYKKKLENCEVDICECGVEELKNIIEAEEYNKGWDENENQTETTLQTPPAYEPPLTDLLACGG